MKQQWRNWDIWAGLFLLLGTCLFVTRGDLLLHPAREAASEESYDEMEERVGYGADLVDVSETSARSPKWRKVRDTFFESHPSCAFKGCDCKGPFNVHHKKPFHLFPEHELDPNNLVTVCAGGTGPDGRESPNHHLWVAHQGDFKDFNPHVARDLAAGVYPAKGLEAKRKHDVKVNRLKSKTTQAP